MFACIFIPNFSVAAVLRAEPELRAQALAIFEGKPPLETICAVGKSAECLGITSGMAKTQAELCPELTLRPRSTVQESLAHAVLLDCAQSFSPCVEDAAADTAIVDLAGMNSLLGTLPEIAHAIFNCALQLGLDANVAIAANPDSAALAARGFSGVTMIPDGKEAEQLGSLPVEVLFAGQEKQEEEADDFLSILERWGIRNLRALAALPEVALSERLGQKGLRFRQLARGEVSRTLVPVEDPVVFEEAAELEFPVVLLEPLSFLLNRMLEQICARLAARALATQELRLTLALEDFQFPNQPSEINARKSSSKPEIGHGQSAICSRSNQFRRTLRLPLPVLDAKLFLKLLQLDLNAHPPGAPIFKIHLAAEPARPRPAQGGLFLPPVPEPEKLELMLARISRLVGEARAGSVELLDTYRAEGFRLKRFAVGAARASTRKKDPSEVVMEARRTPGATVAALRIFRPPLRANVTLKNGAPANVVCAQQEVRGDVLWKAGPWRNSGDWWEREAWSRDEWDIALETNDGVGLFRLVHDLLNGVWFVEGTYD